MQRFIRWSKDLLASRQYLAILASNCFLALPIILFVHRYQDDYLRSISGGFGWTYSGFRPLSDALYFLVNIGAPAIAVSPLYQLAALVVISFASAALARSFGIRSPFWAALATLPLIGQPYFLENLSFGFDSLSMTLALALAVLSALVLLKSEISYRYLLSLLMLFCSLALYQPSASAYLPIGVTILLADALGWSPRLSGQRRTFNYRERALGFCAVYPSAIAGYYLLLRIFWLSRDVYSEKYSETFDFDASLVFGMFANAKIYLGVFLSDWLRAQPGILFVFFLVAGYLLCYSLLRRKSSLATARPARAFGQFVLGFFLFAAFIILLYCCSPGVLLIVRKTFAGVPRTSVFFGAWLSSMNLLLLAAVGKGESMGVRKDPDPLFVISRILLMSSIVGLAWLQIVFSFAYGHAYNAQQELERGVISRLIAAISEVSEVDPQAGENGYLGNFRLRIRGRMPSSPVLINSARKFPLLDRLVVRQIDNNAVYSVTQLQWYGMPMSFKNRGKGLSTGRGCYGDVCTSEFTLQWLEDELQVTFMPR